MVAVRQPQLSTPSKRLLLDGSIDAGPIRLQLPADWGLSDERLLELGSLNEEWYIEADDAGGLLLMAPPGPRSGAREMRIGMQITLWCDSSNRGEAFPSSMFHLPNGWRRAPDAAWISDERLSGIVEDDQIVWRVCPDFVVEIRSQSDSLRAAQDKMDMWISQGAQLGWLVDPLDEVVWIYRPEQRPERLARPPSVTATEIADDLTVDFRRVWPSLKTDAASTQPAD